MGEGNHPVFLLKDIPHQDVKRILGMLQSLIDMQIFSNFKQGFGSALI
jgi:hypothetical protein